MATVGIKGIIHANWYSKTLMSLTMHCIILKLLITTALEAGKYHIKQPHQLYTLQALFTQSSRQGTTHSSYINILWMHDGTTSDELGVAQWQKADKAFWDMFLLAEQLHHTILNIHIYSSQLTNHITAYPT